MNLTHKTAALVFAGLAIYGAGLQGAPESPQTVTANATGSYPTLTTIGAEIAASEQSYSAATEEAEFNAAADRDAADLKDKRTRKATETQPATVNVNEITEDDRVELLELGYMGDPNDGSDDIIYRPDSKPAPYTYDKPVYEETICEIGNGWLGKTYYEKDHILIQYNECNIYYHGGDYTDLEETIAHERAHAAGWKHGQGTPDTNPAFYAGGYNPNFGDGI